MNNAIQEFPAAYLSWYMSNHTMLYKSDIVSIHVISWGIFIVNLFLISFLYFGGFLTKQLFHSCLLDLWDDYSQLGTIHLVGCLSSLIIHQVFSLAHDWFKHFTWLNFPQQKLGNIWEYAPILKTMRVGKNIWRIINTIASNWLWKYAQIFVLGHYLFLKARSFLQATLLENCSLRITDNVRGQISEHVLAPNGGYCLYIQDTLVE